MRALLALIRGKRTPHPCPSPASGRGDAGILPAATQPDSSKRQTLTATPAKSGLSVNSASKAPAEICTPPAVHPFSRLREKVPGGADEGLCLPSSASKKPLTPAPLPQTGEGMPTSCRLPPSQTPANVNACCRPGKGGFRLIAPQRRQQKYAYLRRCLPSPAGGRRCPEGADEGLGLPSSAAKTPHPCPSPANGRGDASILPAAT
jgi:hypothetical protein